MDAPNGQAYDPNYLSVSIKLPDVEDLRGDESTKMDETNEQDHSKGMERPDGEALRDNENQPKAAGEVSKKHDHFEGVDLPAVEPLRVGIDIDREGNGAVRLAVVTIQRKNSNFLEGKSYALWHMRGDDHTKFTSRLYPEGELPSRCTGDWLTVQGYSRTVKEWRLNKDWLASSKSQRNRRLLEVANLLLDGDGSEHFKRKEYCIKELVGLRKPRAIESFNPTAAIKRPEPEVVPNDEEQSTETQSLSLSSEKVVENEKALEDEKREQVEVIEEARIKSRSRMPSLSAATMIYDLTGHDDSIVPIKLERSTVAQSEHSTDEQPTHSTFTQPTHDPPMQPRLPQGLRSLTPSDTPVYAQTEEDLDYEQEMFDLKKRMFEEKYELEKEQLELKHRKKRLRRI